MSRTMAWLWLVWIGILGFLVAAIGIVAALGSSGVFVLVGLIATVAVTWRAICRLDEKG